MSSNAARIVGERVRDGRQKAGATQMDFALSVGMNVAHLGRIERGETNPSLETLVRLAGALDLDLTMLVRGLSLADVPPKPPTYSIRDLIRERDERAG